VPHTRSVDRNVPSPTNAWNAVWCSRSAPEYHGERPVISLTLYLIPLSGPNATRRTEPVRKNKHFASDFRRLSRIVDYNSRAAKANAAIPVGYRAAAPVTTIGLSTTQHPYELQPKSTLAPARA
jgi:hypothetical protein